MLSLIGLTIALVIPALATLRLGFSDMMALPALALVPWLTIAWVRWAERRSLNSIGLSAPRWRTIGFGIAGILVNLTITITVSKACVAFGLREVQSALMSHVLQGSGWLLVFLVTNGALLTEISFRGYAIERIGELLGSRRRLGAVIQIGVTTALFAGGRGWAHAVVWLVDDIVFSIYYLRTRNTPVCIIAHAVPNLMASSLIATGLAH